MNRPKYPIPLLAFLRVACGGRDVGDREALFRAYFKSTLPADMSEADKLAKPGAMLEKFRKEGLSEDDFHLHGIGILSYRIDRAREQRSTAAKALWAKKKRNRFSIPA